MQLFVRRFDELTVQELYVIYRTRSATFVVEQNWVHQDIDALDCEGHHLWLADDEGLQAYLRLVPTGVPGEMRMGRVISLQRRQGLATKIVKEGIRIAREQGATRLILDSQEYVKDLYAKVGFVPAGEIFHKGVIPHLLMALAL